MTYRFMIRYGNTQGKKWTEEFEKVVSNPKAYCKKLRKQNLGHQILHTFFKPIVPKEYRRMRLVPLS
jgi:hypothetical protein